MEISGPACNLRINDNPDNWDIKKEMDAINKPTPGWNKNIDYPLTRAMRQHDIWAVNNIKLRNRINVLEKRWKALRKAVREIIYDEEVVYVDYIQTLMTGITRKIK